MDTTPPAQQGPRADPARGLPGEAHTTTSLPSPQAQAALQQLEAESALIARQLTLFATRRQLLASLLPSDIDARAPAVHE